MSFSISLQSTEGPLGRGTIRLGDFTESFEVVLELWSPEEYRAQWVEALQHIIDGASRSALITSLTDPSTANFLFWWPMYRDHDSVIFQNEVLFLAELDRPFSLERFEEFVPERQTMTEDGEEISEWRVPLSDITDFLGSRGDQ